MESTLPSSAAETERALILIVDDDAAVRESLAAAMEAFGFRANVAANGFEGLHSVETEKPAAIITDLHMPEMDGFELMSALRCAQCLVPVIVISGGVRPGFDFLGAARRMGAAAVFEKPFPVREMIETLTCLTARPAA